MIAEIIETLQSKPFYGRDEYIEIAKGKFELRTDIKGIKRKMVRAWKSGKLISNGNKENNRYRRKHWASCEGG